MRGVLSRAAGRAALAVCVAACGAAGTLLAQGRGASGAGPAAPATPLPGQVAPAAAGFDATLAAAIDGPPPPAAPAVMNRDAAGRTTVRAIRLAAGIRLDGVLDEEVYRSVPPITDFLQQVPVEGAPASERTEAWILFDDTNVYVSARVHDSAPESEWVANEMRRDTNQLRQNDTFTVFFDTFYDRRNGFNFYTNPLGARADQQFTNEGNPNGDWNPVWDVRTGRFAGGWTVEMEIPFKTLRYRSGSPQLWGVQMRRSVRRKNEWTYLTRIPISAGGGRGAAGIFRVSSAATLVGLEPPAASRVLEVKPYAIGGVTTDRHSIPIRDNEGSAAVGADVKLGITQNLTADFTYNTDFAQVEVDEQQVNLTRFSLFFPEKREFFLEGRGIFGFARPGVGAGSPGEPNDAPTLFYSRRIGLEGDAERAPVVVPIHGGRAHDGQGGRVRRRRAQHPDGGVARGGHRLDELHGPPHPARHPAAEQRGSDLHEPVRLAGRPRREPGVRRRRHVLVPRERRLRDLLRAHPDAAGRWPRRQLPGPLRLRRGPLRSHRQPPRRGGELPAGDRLPAAGQLPPHEPVRPVQPPPAERSRPALLAGGGGRLLHDGRPGAGRDARADAWTSRSSSTTATSSRPT